MKNRNRIFTWTLVCLAWLLIFSISATMIDNSSEKASKKTEWVSNQPEERGSASITFESQASGNLNENEFPKPASTVLYTQDFENGGNMPSGWTTQSDGPYSGEECSILIDVSHSPIINPSNPDFASFYSYIDTVAHRNEDLAITESLLDNYDALIIPNSGIHYDANEKTAMVNFRNDGGRIFVIGDYGGYIGGGVLNLLTDFGYIYADDLTDDDDNNNGNIYQIFFDTNNFDSHEIMNEIYHIFYVRGGAFTYTPSGTYNLITSDDDGTATPSNSPVFTVKSDDSGEVLILLDCSLWKDYLMTIGVFEIPIKNYGDNWRLLLNIVDWLNDTSSNPGENDDDNGDNDEEDDDKGNGGKKSDSGIGGKMMNFLLSPIGLITVGGITAALIAIVIVVWVVKKKHRR
ncbi:MAG: hypothetical protein ACFFAN_00685 [Promethearchaeota archaeon]